MGILCTSCLQATIHFQFAAPANIHVPGGNYVIDAPGSYTIRSNAVQHSTGQKNMKVQEEAAS
eukprot:1159006-Pelagomonas_calceolata.AAC.2